jgi:Flp pilus assembly protein TadG
VRRADETGQTSVLLLGLFLVAVLLVAVVVDASAAFLRRQELSTLADGAAVAAADGVSTEQIYLDGVPERVTIDPALARAYVADYLARSGARVRYPGLTYRVSAAGDSVQVQMSAPLDLPLVPPGWAGRTTVASDATAVTLVTR